MQTVVAEVDFEVDATSERHSLKTEDALDLESCEVPVDHGKFINSKILILKNKCPFAFRLASIAQLINFYFTNKIKNKITNINKSIVN